MPKSLKGRPEPSGEAVAVGRDGHRRVNLPLQEGLEEEQGDRAQDEERQAEEGRGRAAVARVPAVTASSRGPAGRGGLK